ncbi:MAG: magnesium chelatase [Nocardioides sp.]|nr:magnesium chelatase [Nocardioides sp.]
MGVAAAHAVALEGATGHVVDVQADVSPGSAGFTMVGRADLALREGVDRCRTAVVNSGLTWPVTKRITVLLSPADLAKRGTHYDLAVAVAVLAAAGEVPVAALRGTVLVGELTLDGGLRSVPGVLPMVLAAAARGVRHVVVPEPQAEEAAMVPGVDVLGLRSLEQVVAELRGDPVPAAPPVAPMSGSRLLTWRGAERLEEVDLGDLRGMPDARYAAEVAAAGGHHLLLSGPKGAGKTSLAERIPTLLPDLTVEEALELTAIHSLAGALEPGDGLITRPPFSAPHHDASKTSLVGGGSGQVRPGEISRAHTGVLLLDEFPLLRSDVLEALRQPLEGGDITVARRDESVTLPARCLLVLACNPCPCGSYGVRPTPGVRATACTCRSQQLRDYRAKLSGPLADRVDITRHVTAVRPHDRAGAPPETSTQVRSRVAAARDRQRERYDGLPWRLNAHVPGPALKDRWPLAPEARDALDRATYDGTLSGRGAVRVHRLAWTVADLRAARAGVAPGDGSTDGPTASDLDVAVRLRTGDPLLSSTLHGAPGSAPADGVAS